MNRLMTLATLSMLFCGLTSHALDLNGEYDFLGRLQNEWKTIDNDQINQHIATVQELEKRPELSKADLTELYLIESGLVGLSAQKNQSGSLGKMSFDRLKDALKLSPKDPKVVKAFAESVASMDETKEYKKVFIQLTLKISLAECSQMALDRLQELPISTDPKERESIQNYINRLQKWVSP